MYQQGLIEPPKAARGHVTAHSANVDGEIQHVTKNTLPADLVSMLAWVPKSSVSIRIDYYYY